MENQIIILPCVKCKSKDSVKYTIIIENEEALVRLHECEICKYQSDFTDVFEFL